MKKSDLSPGQTSKEAQFIEEEEDSLKSSSLWKDTGRRLLKDKMAVAGLIVLSIIILATVFAPLLTSYDPDEVVLSNRFIKPFTGTHILGTDHLGRDLFARILYGGRISVPIGVFAVMIAMTIGVIIGLISGYYRGIVDTVSVFGINILMAFPYVLLAIAIIAALGPGLRNAMIAVSIVGVPFYARIVRGTVLSLREREFILAERALGASDLRIIFRHILPNVISPVIIGATLDVGWMIVMAAGLSFLGLGAQPPTAEWGVMLSDGQKYIRTASYLSLFPGAAIFLVVLSLNFLGDGLRDALDPNLKD